MWLIGSVTAAHRVKQFNLMIPTVCFAYNINILPLLELEMLLRANLRRGAGLCLLLLTLVHEATSQRHKSGRRSNYRLENDDGGHGGSS